jgi:hypothetical protein
MNLVQSILGLLDNLDDQQVAEVRRMLDDKARAAKPAWVPKKGELVLVRDDDRSPWTPFYFRRYTPEAAYPYRVGNDDSVGFKQCKPHPTHLNWVPWSDGDPLPGGRALVKHDNGSVAWWGFRTRASTIVAYCLLDPEKENS